MKVTKKIICITLTLFVIGQLNGCIAWEEQTASGPVSITQPYQNQQGGSVSKRFQESEQKGSSAVETAIEISEKFVKLSEEAVELRQQNKELTAQNEKITAQLNTTSAKLEQTEKELKEANDWLIDMRIELNNWKSNILGFRDEMRDADKAQLKALLDILKLLGGDIQAENTDLAGKSKNEPNEPQI